MFLHGHRGGARPSRGGGQDRRTRGPRGRCGLVIRCRQAHCQRQTHENVALASPWETQHCSVVLPTAAACVFPISFVTRNKFFLPSLFCKFYSQFNNISPVIGKGYNELMKLHLVKSYCLPSRAGGRTPRTPRSGGRPHACSGASCCV